MRVPPTRRFPAIALPCRLMGPQAKQHGAPPSPPAMPPAAPPSSSPPLLPSFLEPLLQWDKDVSYLIYRAYNNNLPRWPLLVLEVSGHGVPWIIAPVLIFLLKPQLSPDASSLMLNFLGVTALDLLALAVLKPLFHRRRPTYNTGIGHVTIHAIDQFSFPSGHATRSGGVAAFLTYARATYLHALHPFIASTAFTIGVYFWAAAVCASRVALGRHHVLDVIVGAVLGVSYIVMWTPFWLSSKFAGWLRSFFLDILHGTSKMAFVGTNTPILSSR